VRKTAYSPSATSYYKILLFHVLINQHHKLEQRNSTSSFFPWMSCNQTAKGLPVVCSIPHIKIILVKRGLLWEISEMLLLPLRGLSVSGCMYINLLMLLLWLCTHVYLFKYNANQNKSCFSDKNIAAFSAISCPGYCVRRVPHCPVAYLMVVGKNFLHTYIPLTLYPEGKARVS
jgi:hypothetical protein